jgi:hypothetical protein
MNSLSARPFGSGPMAAAVLALALFSTATVALAGDINQAAPIVSVTGDGGNVEVAGAGVTVNGAAAKVKAAGALVAVNATSTGDVSVAGAQVTFNGAAGGDLKAVGAVVDVTGSVTGKAEIGGAVSKVAITTGGSLFVAGASVTIAPNNDVRGEMQAYGAVLLIGGHIGGPVQAGGAVVTFDAQADGAVEISGNRIIIGPNARIAGDLTVRSTNAPEIQAGSTISGAVHQLQPPTWWGVAPWQWTAVIAAAIATGTILAGIVLMLFGGRVFAAATENVRHRPLSSFLFGILAFVLIPFIAAILMATVVGLSVGFAILFILPFLIIFGHSVAAAGLASAVLIRRHGETGTFLGLVMLIVGAIVLVAIGLIPWVGPALVGIALILGTGAFMRTIGGRIHRAEPRPLL